MAGATGASAEFSRISQRSTKLQFFCNVSPETRQE